MKFIVSRTSQHSHFAQPCEEAVQENFTSPYAATVWTIQIDSLDSLLALSTKYKCMLVLFPVHHYYSNGLPTLELYDDSRE
jgi:hypothetical protein